MSSPTSDRPEEGARGRRTRPRGEAHEIAQHQRQRLPAAMVAAVAELGYAKVTIKDVVSRAGVSRATFYAHYADKEECFLATLDAIFDDALAGATAAVRDATGWEDALARMIDSLGERVAADPERARVALIEVFGAGPGAVERWTLAQDAVEELARDAFARGPHGDAVSEAIARIVVAGVRRSAVTGLRAGEPGQLGEHAGELLAWATSYAVAGVGAPSGPPLHGGPADEPLPPEDPGAGYFQTPHGRLSLSHRERIQHAIAALVRERGFRGLSVPSITATASISNQTFYAHFRNKEDAFLSTVDDVAADALAVVQSAYDEQRAWPAAVAAALEALLDFAAADPTFSRLAFYDVLTLGPEGRERGEAIFSEFAALLAPGFERHGSDGAPPALIGDAVGAGVWAVIQRELTAGRAGRLPEHAPELVYAVLLPFLGAAEAARIATGG